MSWKVKTAWLGILAAIISAAFAPTRGDRGSGNDAVAPGGVANGGAAANAAAKAKKKRPQLDTELVTALYRVGLQPDHLAAAGVSAQETSAVVAGVKTWLSQHTTTLADVDSRFATAENSQDALIRRVRSGLSSQEERTALDAALSTYASVNTERQGDLDAVFAAGTAGLASGKTTLLTKIRTSWDAWSLPLQYLVVDRAQADWVALRDALDNERVSAKEGVDADPDCQTLLATVRADTTVAAATTSLNTTLGDVTSAWETAAAAQ